MKEKTVVETRASRWIAVSGLVFVAAWVVGLVVTVPPAATAPIATVIAYYQAHREIAMLQTYLISGLTGAALLVFAAALRSALRQVEGESSTLSNILFGAGMVVASLSFLEALFAQVLANHIAATKDAAVIQTLMELNSEVDTYKLLTLGLMTGAVSLLTFRARALPRWLIWVGAIETLLLVIASGSTPLNSAALTAVLYVSGIGLLLWVASVSVIMGRKDQTPRTRSIRSGEGKAVTSIHTS
jgi:hypothetical protein